MTIQMLAQWNGLEEEAIYTLSGAEETRLIALGLARAWAENMDGRSAVALVGTVDPVTGAPTIVTQKADGTTVQSPVSGGGIPILISGPVTITTATQSTYDGQCLEFSSAQTVTLSGAGLTLSFTCIPPSSGNASIAFASGATGNGAATTITRAAASNTMFGVQVRNTASTFVVTGS